MKKLISLVLCFFVLSAATASAVTYQGVDIYHGTSSNGQVDWAALAQQKQFVYIKADEGEHTADEMFSANVAGSKSVGIKWGAYHFLRMYSAESAVKQADYFWSRIKGTGYTLIPAVDCESYDGQQTAEGVRGCIRAFVDEFYKDAGIKPVIYCSTSYANDILHDQFTDCKLWLADYRGSPGATEGWGSTYAAWQYSGSGVISSIANYVDLDIGTSDIFIGNTAQPKPPAAQAANGVYVTSAMPHSYNATATARAQVYDSTGNVASGHYVFAGDKICVLSVNYYRQLLEVVYPTATGYTHGYIKNTAVVWRWSGQWHNGSTPEIVYDSTGTEVGTIFAWESATPLYATAAGYAVAYNTSKGSNSKSGVVKYTGKFSF